MRRALVPVPVVALVAATLVAVSGPVVADGPPGQRPVASQGQVFAEQSSSRARRTRLVAPARIGKARVGMTVAEAMATGQFNQDVENPPCDPIALQPKKPFKRQYVVFVAEDEIIEMDAVGTRMRTAKNVRVDSTYRKVKRAYGDDLTRPREVGYGQWGVYLSKGPRGADRRWIGFLFGEAYVSDGRLRGSDTITLMGVTKGKRPPLLLDGC